MGRVDELLEVSHRHPAPWWAGRYEWIGEGGEPEKARWTKAAGFGVSGLQSMRDELPQQKPTEELRLHCLKKRVLLHSIDLGDDEGVTMTFNEVGANLLDEAFLKSQRQLKEAAMLRAMVTTADTHKTLIKKQMMGKHEDKVDGERKGSRR